MLVFAILLSRFTFIKVKRMFTEMVPTSFWKQGTFLALSAANLDFSSSLPFFRSLYFHKATSIYSLRGTGVG